VHGPAQPFVHGLAGAGHEGRDAEFGQHGRGRLHLGGAPQRVLTGTVGDPVDGGGVGRGQFGRDVLPQPRFVSGGPGGGQGLDDRRRHALVEHAAQELPGGGQPGRAVEHLDAGTERGEGGGVARGADAAGQHRDAQSPPGHRGHHRDVRERDAGRRRDVGQLPLGPRRGRVQVGPQRTLAGASSGLSRGVPAQAGQAGGERVHRGLRAVDAQHQVGFPGRLGLAGGIDHRRRRGHRRIVATDLDPGSGQVTRDGRTGLPQAEDRDDQRLSVQGHHPRGWSAATRAPSGGPAGPPGGREPPGSSSARPAGSPAVAGRLKYSLISSRC
jgi:hypothetical protein